MRRHPASSSVAATFAFTRPLAWPLARPALSARRRANHRTIEPLFPRILAEAPGWLVVDKPAGWHSAAMPTRDDEPSVPDVESWLRLNYPELASLEEAGLVHRLDRSTSGCLLVARSESSRQSLRTRVAEGDPRSGLDKTYVALVKPGLPVEGEFTLHFAGRHRGSAKVTVTRSGPAATRGSCRWRVFRRDRTALPEAFDLVEVELLGPGRRHQIRAGLAFLGHPLAGDDLYRGVVLAELPHGAALHAWRLGIDGQIVESPLPAWANTRISRSQLEGDSRLDLPSRPSRFKRE